MNTEDEVVDVPLAAVPTTSTGLGMNKKWEAIEEIQIVKNLEKLLGERQVPPGGDDSVKIQRMAQEKESVWIPMMKRVFLEKTKEWAEAKKKGIKYVDPGKEAHEQCLELRRLEKEEEELFVKSMSQMELLSKLPDPLQPEPTPPLDLSPEALAKHKKNVEMVQFLMRKAIKTPPNTPKGKAFWAKTRRLYNSVMDMDGQISRARYRDD